MYQAYNLIRQTRVTSTYDSSVTPRSKYLKSQTSIKLEGIEDTKFQKVMPNTDTVIFAWNKKILSILNNSFYSKKKIYSQ